MRCVIFNRFGNPAEVLEPSESPVPEVGPGQVGLRLILSPIHHHDLAIVRGTYGYRPNLPAIPGTEAVAKVVALGEGVTNVGLGQRVCVPGAGAAWAEQFVVPAEAAVPIPETVPDETASQLLAMPLSAAMLLDDLRMKPGDWLIQNAANGAVGKVLNVLAKPRGINVLNLVRRRAGIKDLHAAGADHVLSTEEPDWATQVKRITGGAPIHRGVDSVGGRATNDLLKLMAPGGLLMLSGALSGEPFSMDVGHVVFKQITLRGFWGSKRGETTNRADLLHHVDNLVQLAISGALQLPVTGCFGFSQVRQAIMACTEPGRPGKVLIMGD
jgi:NADPH:quinone reductase-like Zn-dependent oxidoreductase